MKLTREEIEKMEAGREMDALIAEKVMGWEWWHFNKRSHLSAHESEPFYLEAGWIKGRDDNTPITDTSNCPHYSTDIAAAWEVEQKIYETGERTSRLKSVKDKYIFALMKIIDDSFDVCCGFIEFGIDNALALAHATPEQKCRAALLAVMDLS